jgi:glycosyltransferase involved in cell wall biosynthesis
MRRFLLVAYHFPPLSGSSGFLRSLKFSRNLLNHGWKATVLTTHPRAYERTENTQLSQIPPEVEVIRAFALDTRRHLSIRGRYLRFLALPDRWVSWCLGAVPAGLRAIRREKIDVIFTTHPIATAILIGWILYRLSGKLWVCDFRDLMSENDYPTDPLTRRVYRWIERKAVLHASRIIFTAPSAIDVYLARYPDISREKYVLIPNGYEEEDFQDLPPGVQQRVREGAPIRLLHSGLVYPQERDPRPFLLALSRLKREGAVSAQTLQIDLRASGSDDFYTNLISGLDLADVVRLLPPLPYRESLRETAAADALLLLQSAWCSQQIPAKAYEYLRVRKPILALTNHDGDTGRLLAETGGATIIPLEDEAAIYRALPAFLESVRSGSHPLVKEDQAPRFSRTQQAAELAHLFDALATESHSCD